MPANLTPEYKAAEEAFRRANTPDEKLVALKRMLSTIPKHKGTEKLQADIKRRIKLLNDQIQSQTRKRGFAVRVEREGAGQVAVVGPPNAGKSRLVAALSGVHVEVADYPYSTQKPAPAMMEYEDVQVQLVDLPPVSSEHLENWLPNIVRTADAALLVGNLASPDVLEQVEDTLTTLEDKNVRLVGGEPDPDPWARVAEKRTRLALTRADEPGTEANLEVVRELYGDRFPISVVSGSRGDGVDDLRIEIFRMLRIVRVYSKPPGKEPDRSRPFVLGQGSTLMDFARTVHKDLADHLKFARVWGRDTFDGQRVTKDYRILDGDVIELH